MSEFMVNLGIESGVIILATAAILFILLKLINQVKQIDRKLREQETWLTSSASSPDGLIGSLMDQLKLQGQQLTEVAALINLNLTESSGKITAAADSLLQAGKAVNQDSENAENLIKGYVASLKDVAGLVQLTHTKFGETLGDDLRKLEQQLRQYETMIAGVSEKTHTIGLNILDVKLMIGDQLAEYKTIESSLKASGIEVIQSLGQAVKSQDEVIQTMRLSLSETIAELQGARRDISQESQELVKNFTHQREEMTAASLEAKDTSEQLGLILSSRLQEITQANHDLQHQASEGATNLTKLLDSIKAQLERLMTQADEIESRLFTHSEETIMRLGEGAGSMTKAVEPVLLHAGELTKRLGDQQQQLSDLEQKILPQLQQVEEVVLKGKEWQFGLDELTKLLGNIADQFGLEREKLGGEVTQIRNSFADTTNEAYEKSRQITEAVKQHGEELLLILNQASSRLAADGGEFASRAGMVSDAATNAINQIDNLVKMMDLQSEKLTSSSVAAGMQFNDHQDNMAKQATLLQKAAQEAGEVLARMEGEFHSTESKLLTTQTQVAEGWNGLSKKLHQQVADSQEIHDHVRGQLKSLYDTIAAQTSLLEQAIGLADGKLSHFGELIRKEGGDMELIADQLTEKARVTGQALSDEANHLSLVAERSLNNARQIRDQHETEARDLFNRTSRHIIEDLNSISIDLTRALDGDVSEADWRRYIKGDRTIFSRSLLRNRQDALIRKIGERVRNDGLMRGYVTRYVELFDQLLVGAAKSDSENLLHATFLTSDVGKLYIILNKALGRED